MSDQSLDISSKIYVIYVHIHRASSLITTTHTSLRGSLLVKVITFWKILEIDRLAYSEIRAQQIAAFSIP